MSKEKKRIDSRKIWMDWAVTVEIKGSRNVQLGCRRVIVYMLSTAGQIPFMFDEPQISFFGSIKRMREFLGISSSTMARYLNNLYDSGILEKKAERSWILKRKK